MQRAGLDALSLAPADPELVDTFSRLRGRQFIPPAPMALPRGTALGIERALGRRDPAEVAQLAASIVAVPDGAELSSPEARALLEVFIAARDPRAERLLERLREVTPENERAPLAHAALRLSIARGRPDTGPLAALSGALLADGLARLVTHLLAGQPGPETLGTRHGLQWIVPVVAADGQRHLANAGLATLRRPALVAELGEVGDLLRRWLALQPELARADHDSLATAEVFDGEGRFDDASRHLERHLGSDPEALAQIAAARAELLPVSGVLPDALPRRVSLPTTDQHAAWAKLARGEAVSPLVEGALRERLHDTRGAARVFAEGALATPSGADADLVALAHEAVRLLSELARPLRLALVERLSSAELEDEVVLARDEVARRKAELVSRLAPTPLLSARLATGQPPVGQPGFASPSAMASGYAENDPHHPASRLAAASDLLAEDRLEPACNILAALLRKAEAETPERLFTVVATALEADEPPDELVHAAQRALDDDDRAPRLMAALRRSATAAFALHEPLLALSKDPSRADPLRLMALESWLNIWAETDTAPNPELLATLREAEPGLLCAAAIAIGAPAEPVTALGELLSNVTAFGTTASSWSLALLSAMTGKPAAA